MMQEAGPCLTLRRLSVSASSTKPTGPARHSPAAVSAPHRPRPAGPARAEMLRDCRKRPARARSRRCISIQRSVVRPAARAAGAPESPASPRPDDSDVGFCPSRSATRTGSGRGGPRPAAYWPGGSCRGCRPSNAAAAAPPRRPKPVRGVGSLSRRRCTDFPVASAACPPESRRRPASRRGGRRRRFPRQSESALQVGPRPGAARPALEGRGGLHRAGLGRTDR